MSYSNNLVGICKMLDAVGLVDENISDINTQVIKSGTYYLFKLYDLSPKESFVLGTLLGETFGSQNVCIEVYKSTSKYRGYTLIDLKK